MRSWSQEHIPARGRLKAGWWVLGDLHDGRHRSNLMQRRLEFSHLYTCDTERPDIALHTRSTVSHGGLQCSHRTCASEPFRCTERSQC
jgi:hypothetical protein